MLSHLDQRRAALDAAAMAMTIIVQPGISHFIEGFELSKLNGREALEEYSSFWLKILLPAKAELVKAPVLMADHNS